MAQLATSSCYDMAWSDLELVLWANGTLPLERAGRSREQTRTDLRHGGNLCCNGMEYITIGAHCSDPAAVLVASTAMENSYILCDFRLGKVVGSTERNGQVTEMTATNDSAHDDPSTCPRVRPLCQV